MEKRICGVFVCPFFVEHFVQRLLEGAPPRVPASAAREAALCAVAAFFLLHEEIQDTILEELVAVLPVVAGGALNALPRSARRGGIGEAVALAIVVVLCLVAYMVSGGVVRL